MKFLFLLFTLFTTPILCSQDGSPDSSFGVNGVVLREFDGFEMNINSIIELQNTNILLSASAFLDQETRFLMQVDPDGKPVNSFGTEGILNLPENIEIFSIKQQISENEFLVYGINSEINGLFKIDTDLNINESYGVNGVLIVTENTLHKVKYLVLEDGSVLIAKHNNETITINKYTPNGTIDTAFTEISIPNSLNIDLLFDFKLKNDGSYIIGLREDNNQEIAHYIYNISVDGQLNGGFGNQGVSLLPEPEFIDIPYFINLTVLDNDQILINRNISEWWGDENNPTETKIYKLNANGSLNTNFGNTGHVTVNNYYGGAKEQENGRLLYFGTSSDFEGGLNITMRRYYNNGTIDDSFNFQSNYGELGTCHVLHHSNEKIYVIGSDIWYNAPPMNFVMLRYNNSPLGVEENYVNDVIISPNPSDGVFNIYFSSGFLNANNYSVYDTKGKLLMEGKFQQTTSKLDLSPLSTGVYFLKIESKTYKILKK